MSQSQTGASSQAGTGIAGSAYFTRDPIEKCTVEGQEYIRQLRSSVHATLHSLSESGGNPPKLLNEIRNAAAQTAEKYEKIDQAAKTTQKTIQEPLVTGSLLNLMEESSHTLPSTETQPKLIDQYQWGEKNREYATYLHTMMVPPRKSNSVALPKPKPTPLTRHPLEMINNHIADMQKRHTPYMKLELCAESTETQQIMLVDICQSRSTPQVPDQSAAVVVFRVCLLMKTMFPQWCTVIGPDEHFRVDANKQVEINIESHHEVFKKLSTYLKSVILTANPSVYHFLSWLVNNRFLFNTPCASCKQFLKGGLPAFCFDTKQPPGNMRQKAYHESCKP